MIYSFGLSNSKFPTGSASMKEVLGGKGANLAEMCSLGVPVPPGFTFPCELSVKCSGTSVPDAVFDAVVSALTEGMVELEEHFGYTPLVSVRSGARVSMPGMMDTILNVGLSGDNLQFWCDKIGEKAALDSYRRLIQMYSSVVLGVPLQKFEAALSQLKQEFGVTHDHELSPPALSLLVGKFLELSPEFPQSPQEQLIGAVLAVFRSWNNDRAKEYRKIYSIPDSWGTAATVQSMVFGNSGTDSCTGVVFTRDPSTGENELVGEFLVNAQGEDVVAGIRTPEPIDKMQDWNDPAFSELLSFLFKLEDHYRDMQDVEFTVQSGRLYILQTRSGKRSPLAAFRIAGELLLDSVITPQEASSRLSKDALLKMTCNSISEGYDVEPDLIGVAGGGQVVSGVAVFSAADAVVCKEPCILIRSETDPDDIAGMNASVGVLTATGGLTSHAAVVARGMGKTCVVGATDLSVGFNSAKVGSKQFPKGCKVTIDGETGRVWFDKDVPVISGDLPYEVLSTLALISGGAVRLPVSDTSIDALVELLSPFASSEKVSVELDAAAFNAKTITNLAAALYQLHLRVLLNLTPPWGEVHKADQFFSTHIGGMDLNSIWEKDMATVMQGFDPDVKKLLVLHGGSGSMMKLLKSFGFSGKGEVKTVADMIEFGSVVPFSPSLAQAFGTKEAFDYIVSCLSKDGKLSKSDLAPGTYWFEVLS